MSFKHAIAFYSMMIFSAFGGQTIDYRLELKISVDGAVYTGSGVIETQWSNHSFLKGLAQGRPWHVDVRGEAIPINLGNHGVVFVLLRGDPLRHQSPLNPQSLLAQAFENRTVGGLSSKELETIAHTRRPINIAADQLPMMVRFADISDPMTVERVDPQDLTQSYGPQARVVSAVLSITDAPRTSGIVRILPWLAQLNGAYLTGKHISGPGLPGHLNAGDFNAGED